MDDLKTKFTAVESIFRFYQGRGQLGALFDDLKVAVQRTCKKLITTHDIGRLLRLVPELYQVKWVQSRDYKNAYDDKKSYSYQLQIAPRNHLAESKADLNLQFIK